MDAFFSFLEKLINKLFGNGNEKRQNLQINVNTNSSSNGNSVTGSNYEKNKSRKMRPKMKKIFPKNSKKNFLSIKSRIYCSTARSKIYKFNRIRKDFTHNIGVTVTISNKSNQTLSYPVKIALLDRKKGNQITQFTKTITIKPHSNYEDDVYFDYRDFLKIYPGEYIVVLYVDGIKMKQFSVHIVKRDG